MLDTYRQGRRPACRASASQPAAGRRSGHRLARPRPADGAAAWRLRRGSKGETSRVFVLMSDGESEEGSVWEAAMFAAAQKLDNVCVIVDYNKWQATGRSERDHGAGAACARNGGPSAGTPARSTATTSAPCAAPWQHVPDGSGQAGGASSRTPSRARACRSWRTTTTGITASRRPKKSAGPVEELGSGMRNAFAAEITELAATDPRIVLLSGDIGNRLFDKFRDASTRRASTTAAWPRPT